VLEAPQPGLDLAVVNEQVADLGREFRDLIRDMMQGECAHRDQHSSVFEHCFDLRDERVIDFEGLHRSQCRLGEHRACDRDGVDHVGLRETPLATRVRGALRRNFARVEPCGDDRDRDVRTPRALLR
jgi:hypothetical protein